MDTFPSRLAGVIDKSGLGRPEFAARAGVGTSALAKWLSGKLMPKSEQLRNLAITGGVSMEWLLTGKGPKSLGMVDMRKRFLLIAATISTITARTNPEVVRLISDALYLLDADALQKDMPPDDPFWVSPRDLIEFAERFKAAEYEDKLNLLESDRKIAENNPDILATFETLLSEHVAAITNPKRAQLVIDRAQQIVNLKAGLPD